MRKKVDLEIKELHTNIKSNLYTHTQYLLTYIHTYFWLETFAFIHQRS